MTDKEKSSSKSNKHESKVREYEVEFVMKDKSSKKVFNTSQEIYLLYVHCSKEFQCGLFSLYFNGINLNFIDKNTKLSTIFKKDTKNPRIIVMAKDNQFLGKKNNFELNVSDVVNQYTKINFDKGTLSETLREISNNDFIDEIQIVDEKIDENEVLCFFTKIANKNINKLVINPIFLSYIDNIILSLNLHCFTYLKELVIQGQKRSVAIIRKIETEIKNLSFPNLQKLNLIYSNIKFSKINFGNFEKLELNNSFISFPKMENQENNILFSSLSFLGLYYICISDLYQQLDIVMKRTKSLDILKLKLDSIDFDNCFNFTDFCCVNQKNIEKIKNIEINIKSKFIFEEPTVKDKKKCVDKFLRKTVKLKLTPFSKFTEKELNYFGDKLSNINLLKLENIDIEEEKELKKFLDNYPDLEYISLDEKYNYIIPSKIYKLNIHSIEDIKNNKTKFKNLINSLKFDKLEKIEMPFFEFNRKNKSLKILGDLVPYEGPKQNEEKEENKKEENQKEEKEKKGDNTDNNKDISITDLEEVFILLKKILFNIPIIEKLILQNFENENKASYLNNFLIGFMNLISSPKIKKLKLIDVFIDKGLIDKFSFMFMNSSTCLTSLELNNIKIEQNEMEYLFYTLVFQIDYQKLATLRLKNLDINYTFAKVIDEFNIFQKVDHIECESLNNFDLIKKTVFTLTNNIGISFKNLKISTEELTNYLIDNGDYLQKIVLDLENIPLFEVLNNDKILFRELRTLKLYESFDNYDDDTKFKFLEDKWLTMKKLKKLYLYIKSSSSNQNRSKEKELISLFKYIKQIIV